MSPLTRFAVHAVVHAGLIAACASAHAADDEDPKKKEAQAYFDEGLRLHKAGDPRSAIKSFREAYARFPSFRVHYNIAQLCARINDAGCAVRAYERYLREGGDDVPAKRKSDIAVEVKQLSKTLGRVTIACNVTGAEVLLDDEPLGRSPLPEKIALNGGQHKLVAVLEDATRAEKTFSLVAGGTANVEIVLEKKAPPPVEAKTKDKDKEKERAAADQAAAKANEPTPFPVLPWAITGGLAAATAVSGLLASSAYSSYEDTRKAYPITREQLESSHGSARDLFLLTTAFGIATVVSAGVATYFTLGGKTPEPMKPSDKEKDGAAASRAPSPRPVALVPTLGGIVLVGGLP
jgi:tetratricopeptide (TPR) repeat protein